jgi:hypothetical protein
VIPGEGEILDNRANVLLPSQAVFANPVAVPGGVQLLNPQAFGPAAASTLGNTGRNAFTGPGFYSFDLSLARAFHLGWLGEAGQLRIRADAYNLLNHANLGNPDAQLNDPEFGVATYGRQGYPSGFPAVAPLNETPREIQLSVRIAF